MKSVVVEIKGKFAAVLSDDGSIKKVKNRNYVIGQEIWPVQREEVMKMKKLHITKKLAVCAASAAIMLFSSGVGVWAYTTPYSYVSLDVNPSIEYTLNRFERVIKVEAVNDDGQTILNEVDISDLNNKSIEDAILATVQQISEEGYFTGSNPEPVKATASEATETGETETATATASEAVDSSTDAESVTSIDGGIVITVSSGNLKLSDKFVSEIREAVEGFVDETVEIQVTSVGLERVQEARALGVTPGKLNLVEKLKESASDPDSIAIEEWINKPVKDIMKEIKKNRETAVADQPDTSDNIATSSNAVQVNRDEEATDIIEPSNENGKAADKKRNGNASDKMESGKTEKTGEEKEIKNQIKEEVKAKQEGEKQQKAEIKVQNKEEKESEKAASKAEEAESSNEVKEKQEKAENSNKDKEKPEKKSNSGNSKKN